MDEIEPESDSTILLQILRPYEIYLFNLYIFFTLLIILCTISVLIPEDFISDTLGIIFPQKYWFIAIPTHILTTLLGLSICVKGFELINTIDDPPVEDDYSHILSEEEMMKEINYSPEEGILPDAGDINIDVVKQVINMDNDEEDENDNIKNNEYNIEYFGLKNELKNKEKNET
jgi:hypothetical protein